MSTGLFGNIPPPAWLDLFDAFWAQGIFRKLGKTEARRHLRTTVKTDKDWTDLYMAHEHYKRDLQKNPRPLLHGSTFCNTWRDYLELKDSEPVAVSTREADPQILKVLRWCKEGKPADWDPNPEWIKGYLKRRTE